MLWFFALTEDSTAFRQYAEMLMVAVHTARKFTSLVPYFIYDGSDNDFTVWLRNTTFGSFGTAVCFAMLWRS